MSRFQTTLLLIAMFFLGGLIFSQSNQAQIPAPASKPKWKFEFKEISGQSVSDLSNELEELAFRLRYGDTFEVEIVGFTNSSPGKYLVLVKHQLAAR